MPEEGVFGRVAEFELGAHFDGEVIGIVLGLEHAMRDAVAVEENAVEFERRDPFAGHGVFADKRPTERTGGGFDQGVEGGADGGFVGGTDVGQLGEGEVITTDGLVGGLERKGRSSR